MTRLPRSGRAARLSGLPLPAALDLEMITLVARTAMQRWPVWEDQPKRERWAGPLLAAAKHGIPMGSQWHLLGRLAWRYARAFSEHDLARLVWWVTVNSRQDQRQPWTWRHALDIARRAKRFIEREDAREAQRLAEFARWAELRQRQRGGAR